MKIGDLVKWMTFTDERFWLAIVVGEPVWAIGTGKTEVQWVTGKYVGERDYIYTEDLWEVA